MIRRVGVLDRDLLWNCHYIVNSFMDAGDGGGWFGQKILVDSGMSVMFVDEKENGFLKGFIIGNMDANVAIVDGLFVDKKFHRSGVGSALLRAYEDWARGEGTNRIKLRSRPTRQALDFYKKHGFERINWNNYMQKTL